MILFTPTSQFPVRSGQRLEVEVTVYDAESRPFDNFTSLLWRWSSSDQKLLPTPQMSSLTHREGKGQYMAAVYLKWEIFLERTVCQEKCTNLCWYYKESTVETLIVLILCSGKSWLRLFIIHRWSLGFNSIG